MKSMNNFLQMSCITYLYLKNLPFYINLKNFWKIFQKFWKKKFSKISKTLKKISKKKFPKKILVRNVVATQICEFWSNFLFGSALESWKCILWVLMKNVIIQSSYMFKYMSYKFKKWKVWTISFQMSCITYLYL